MINLFSCSAEHVHTNVKGVPLSSRLFTRPKIIREFNPKLTHDNIHLSRSMFGPDFQTFPRCATWISHLQNWEMEKSENRNASSAEKKKKNKNKKSSQNICAGSNDEAICAATANKQQNQCHMVKYFNSTHHSNNSTSRPAPAATPCAGHVVRDHERNAISVHY